MAKRTPAQKVQDSKSGNQQKAERKARDKKYDDSLDKSQRESAKRYPGGVDAKTIREKDGKKRLKKAKKTLKDYKPKSNTPGIDEAVAYFKKTESKKKGK
jgi:hypothetical protein